MRNIPKTILIAIVNFCCEPSSSETPPPIPCSEYVYVHSFEQGICNIQGSGPACANFTFVQNIGTNCSSKDAIIKPQNIELCHLEILLEQGQTFFADIHVVPDSVHKCPLRVLEDRVQIQ